MVLNKELLTEKIRVSGYRRHYLAERIGLSYPAFVAKLSGASDFKAKEIRCLAEIIGLDGAEINEIFFGRMESY
jgi:hypothetical protein